MHILFGFISCLIQARIFRKSKLNETSLPFWKLYGCCWTTLCKVVGRPSYASCTQWEWTKELSYFRENFCYFWTQPEMQHEWNWVYLKCLSIGVTFRTMKKLRTLTQIHTYWRWNHWKSTQEEKERMEEIKCKIKGKEKKTECIRTEESRERVK